MGSRPLARVGSQLQQNPQLRHLRNNKPPPRRKCLELEQSLLGSEAWPKKIQEDFCKLGQKRKKTSQCFLANKSHQDLGSASNRRVQVDLALQADLGSNSQVEVLLASNSHKLSQSLLEVANLPNLQAGDPAVTSPQQADLGSPQALELRSQQQDLGTPNHQDLVSSSLLEVGSRCKPNLLGSKERM